MKGGYYNEIGKENIFETKHEAIKEIFKRLDSDVCKGCSVRIFKECTV